MGSRSVAAEKSKSFRLANSFKVLGAESDSEARMRIECSLTVPANL